MSCWIRQLTEEEKRLNFLLCPLKSFTSSEQKLFTLAALCDPYSGNDTTPACGDNNISSDCNHKIRSTSLSSYTKCEQHYETDASQENHETSTSDTVTNADEGKSTHTNPVGTTGVSASAATVDTSSVMCYTLTRTPHTSECTTKPSLFTPLPNVPSPLFQQNYTKWKAVMDNHFRLRQLRRHKTIYIQPLDDFPEFIYNSIGNDTDTVNSTKMGGFFELLSEYLKVFFSGLNVVLQPAIKTTGWAVKSRHHHMTGKKQLLVGDVHTGLTKILPKDGCCIVGVTWTDLYPCEDLNFVLGEASVEHKCAAFCFGRYEPKCYIDGKEPAQMKEIDGFIIWKMLKVRQTPFLLITLLILKYSLLRLVPALHW